MLLYIQLIGFSRIFYMTIVYTNKNNRTLRSPGASNIQETPGCKKRYFEKKNKNKNKLMN